MRSVTLSKSGLNKLRSQQLELKSGDFDDSLKSLVPGEWCRLLAGTEEWVGFINSQIEEKYSCAHVVARLGKDESFRPEVFLTSRIENAYQRRKAIKDYASNARMVYGASDGLPGLIIDQFQNASIIQINTAGMDRYRDLIQELVLRLGGVEAYFLDNPKYREKEFLPIFETKSFPELHVVENGLNYRIRPEVLQKVGFYYDHRENRLNLLHLLGRLERSYEHGVDLFCYAGAWGMTGLKAGVKEMTFVDQGDFEAEVNVGLSLNQFENRGKYIRGDVFKFLDEQVKASRKFDVILCDPPAFAKSLTQKAQALEGYSKLHRRVFKLSSAGALIAFSSCTHYVSHEDFQKNISDAALKENRKIQLVYSGMQGFDHPVTSLSDRSNYIKSYFYLVE